MKTSLLLAPSLLLGLALSPLGCVTSDGSGSGYTGPLPEPTDWHAQLTGPLDQESMTVAVGQDGRVVVAGFAEGTSDLGLGPTSPMGVHDLFVTVYAPDGQAMSVHRFRGYDVLVTDLAIDQEGGIYLTGYFGDGPLMLGDVATLVPEGYEDGFLAKLDADGAPLWARSWGGAEDFSAGGAIAIAKNRDVFVAGNQTYDFVFGRYSPDGEPRFETHTGSAMSNLSFFSAVQSAVFTPDGDVYLTGNSSDHFQLGDVDDPASFPKIFAARISGMDGHPLWVRDFGSDEGFYVNEGRAVVLAPDGDPVFAGNFAGTLDFGDAVLQGGASSFVAKLDAATGAHVWSRAVSSDRTSLARDSGGNLVLAGSHTEQTEAAGTSLPPGSFLLGISPEDGADLWARPLPEMGNSVSNSENGVFGTGDLAMGPDDQVTLVTSFFDSAQTSFGTIESEGWGDVFVVQLASSSP